MSRRRGDELRDIIVVPNSLTLFNLACYTQAVRNSTPRYVSKGVILPNIINGARDAGEYKN